jgi:2OG-Fe(II) oxygenase superfamily
MEDMVTVVPPVTVVVVVVTVVLVVVTVVVVEVINMKNINQFANILPLELTDSLDQFVSNLNWKYGWRSNNNMGYAHWNTDFTNVIAANGIDVSDQLPEVLKTIWQYISTTHFPNSTLIRCYANSHTFGTEGYPHTDSKRPEDQTAILYLNKTWLREWGGETVLYNGNEITHAELPKYNNLLVFPGNLYHKAGAVSRISPELRITLMFKFAPALLDPMRDCVQIFLTEIGADKMHHGNTKLINHLLTVYDLLRAKNQSITTCCAGAAHSVFGTNIYTTPTLPRSHRDRLAEVIGEEATQLAELFSQINRPNTLELALSNRTTELTLRDNSKIAVDKPTLNNLCAIECANLQDQSVLSRYKNLQYYWDKYC